MPNLGQLRTNIKGRANISAESSFDTLITLWLNDGQRDIANRYLLDMLRDSQDLPTGAGQEEYALNQPCIVYDGRNYTSNIPLTFIRDSEFDRLLPTGSLTLGSPRYYRMSGQTQTSSSVPPVPKIQLYPVPDNVYTLKIRYYRRMPDLVSDTDYSLLPEAYHELLINYCLAILFSSQGDPRAAEQRGLYENGLLSLVEQQLAQPADQIDVLRSMDDGPYSGFAQLPSNYPIN